MKNTITSALVVIAALAVLLSARPAAPAAPRAFDPEPAAQTCDLEAYVIDPDPKGLNVRDAPGPGGRVVAVIPLDGDGTVVHLVASNPGGWVRIDRAETVGGTVVFDKKGWVSGNMLGIETRGYGTRGVKLYPAASAKGKAVGTIPPETEVKVAGCSGDMMRVRYRSLTGWLDRDSQCPSPVTTCN